eukprot:g437.t1
MSAVKKLFSFGKSRSSSANIAQKMKAAEEKYKASLKTHTFKKDTSLKDFELLQTLGTGTFGRVRLCRRLLESHVPLALKICKKSEIIRLKQVDHLLSEKHLLSQLCHPFIIRLHAFFQDTYNIYFVLEYVQAGELFTHLRSAGKFTVSRSRAYAAEILLVLQHLHSLSIVYRDLKPENILLDCQGHVKICDFGFAKIVKDRTWTLCGTPEYLAPEIIQSKGHGPPADWWAYGILLFEMMAGYPPFYDESPFGIYQKILNGKVTYPRHFDDDSKSLVSRLLNNDRTKRLGRFHLVFLSNIADERFQYIN